MAEMTIRFPLEICARTVNADITVDYFPNHDTDPLDVLDVDLLDDSGSLLHCPEWLVGAVKELLSEDSIQYERLLAATVEQHSNLDFGMAK